MLNSQQLELLPVRYDGRFLESHAGYNIFNKPVIAIIELIANAWDAYACNVNIQWPNLSSNISFSIEDDGCGMTAEEFEERWMTLSYNRLRYQGEFAEAPPSKTNSPKRKTFGQNGLGRHAAFCFSPNNGEFFVETRKNGQYSKFRVWIPITGERPLACERIDSGETDITGTKIYTKEPIEIQINSEQIRSEIGLRFLRDPEFLVRVNNDLVTFSDIPDENVNTNNADKTTKFHGIAWHVRERLVGEASWKNFDDQSFIDGRTKEAKRYAFIIKADGLKIEHIKSDWTGLKKDNKIVQNAMNMVNSEIKQFILKITESERQNTTKDLQKQNRSLINRMSLIEAETWNKFIKEVQEQCSSMTHKDLENTAKILAKLESSNSKYSVLEKLRQISINDLDELDNILGEWDINTAKIVLDELQTRLKLINEIQKKVDNDSTDEVKELQPLFKDGLWIFGPEFETIEYTSNQGMTAVIQKFFDPKGKGSRNRADFVITPDSTIGFYSYPEYDEFGSELGPKNIVIVELKAPDIPLGEEEIEQPWKYIMELLEKGYFNENFTKARCFVLGKSIKKFRDGESTKLDGRVKILPLRYNTFLDRAKSRTLNLYEKVKSAPFFDREELEDFLDRGGVNQEEQGLIEFET
jgi:Histidine kinase-, DNA gyrase B-, and HSP90-like ATPase